MHLVVYAGDISHSFVMWHASSCCRAILLDFSEDIYCIKLETAPSLFFRLMRTVLPAVFMPMYFLFSSVFPKDERAV